MTRSFVRYAHAPAEAGIPPEIRPGYTVDLNLSGHQNFTATGVFRKGVAQLANFVLILILTSTLVLLFLFCIFAPK